MAATDPAPHVFNASMGARLEVLYASPQIVAQRRRFRALLDVRAGESGVDVGCGVGHLTCELAEDVGVAGRMTGIDASADMLAGAATRVHARRLEDRVALREGDAIALGLPDASADFIVAVQTYSYVPDIVAAIAEAARTNTCGGAGEHVGARIEAGHAAGRADVVCELAGEVADTAADVDTGLAGANVEQGAKAPTLGDDLRAGIEHFEARAHRGVEDVRGGVGVGQGDLRICTDNVSVSRAARAPLPPTTGPSHIQG